MNKQTKLQLLELFKELGDEIDVEETPEYDSVDFMPIASDRHTHTEAILALANDVGAACEEEMAEPARVATGVTAD